MKVLPIILLMVLGLFTDGSAQSGRRGKPEAVPTATPQVQITQDVRETPESVGYSESSPNAPRSISVRTRNDKKSKKETKRQRNCQPKQLMRQTPATANPDEEK
jgi:hypothetical protein